MVQVTDNYGPGRNGQMYAVQQLEGTLLAAGHEVILAAPKTKGPNPYAGHPRRTEVRFPSVKVIGVPARVATGLKHERRFRRILELKPDIVHVHGLGPLGLLATLAAKRAKVPLVVTWHTDFDAYAEHYQAVTPVLAVAHRVWRMATEGGVDRDQNRAGRARTADRGRMVSELLGAAAAMLGVATVVTTPSEKARRRALRLNPDANVRSLPNGVDPLPDAPNQAVRRFDGVRFVYVGRISPEKGVLTVVKAFKIVNRLVPATELMIVGAWKRDPQMRARLTRLKTRQKGLNLVGEVDRSMLKPYYASADVFCFGSTTDTQALVLHEAAYEGLAFVSCDPELDLVIRPGVNGEFCDPTPDAVAGAMLRMIDKVHDRAWRERAAETSRTLAARYPVAGQNEQMLQLYDEIAAADPVRAH